MAINKIPKNYYSDTNIRRDKINEIIDEVNDIASIPSPSAVDAGKVIKVNDSGVYALSDDLHTPVVANPEGTPTADLNSITIGDTIYKVNDARVNKILALRFTIDNGGTYNANLPQISIVNEHDEAAVLPTNTMTCNKPVQYGALTPTGTPGVLVENLPAEITLTFAAEFNIEDYPNIKLTKGALFPQDIAKNIKIEYSLNSEDWVEIADLVSIDWTGDYHIYDMSTGEETTTTPAIPTPTAADAGKVLTVGNNGAWEVDNVPAELPTVTSADAGKVLAVNNQGAWELKSENIKVYIATYRSGTYYLSEEQYSTIKSDYDLGIIFVIKAGNDSYNGCNCNNYTASAYRLTVTGSSLNAYYITVDLSNGECTITSKSIT